MTPAEVAAWTAGSRLTQGLPERIEDEAVLSKILTLAFGDAEEDGDRGAA